MQWVFCPAAERSILRDSREEGSGGYDQASFNYVYVDGIKQKLMGNGGDALKRFEQAIKINPGSDACYYQISQILASTGDNINARKYLKKAIDIDDKNEWYLMMIGGLYYQDKNLDSAIYYYEKAVKYYPGEENLQLTLGNLFAENKNYNQAISIFDSFDKKYGVNENSTVLTIRTLMMAGRYDEALEKANVRVGWPVTVIVTTPAVGACVSVSV